MKHRFANIAYVDAHQQLPNGLGQWAFQPADAYWPSGAPMTEHTIWPPSTLTYADAKRWIADTQPVGRYDLLP